MGRTKASQETLLRIDLHVHTSRHSACGRSSPEEMVARAISLGLDAIVFTEHNLYWPADELAALQAQYPQIRLFNGIEVTASDGHDYLVYGPPRPDLLRCRLEGGEIVRQAHRFGSVVVLAHPYRFERPLPKHLSNGRPVDGIEILSSNTHNYAHLPARELAHSLNAFEIAASDGHHTRTLGLYYVDLDTPVSSEAELAKALAARAFSLGIDRPRVQALNEEIASCFDLILQLAAQGLDEQAIRGRLPIPLSLTVIRGAMAGRDVLRPISLNGAGPSATS